MGLDMYLCKRNKKTNELEEICYWRKANMIHNWFVENVQNGEDDCKEYSVTRENIQALYDLCKQVLDKSIMEKSKICTSVVYDKDGKHEKYEDGFIISNWEIARDLLPTQDGFFFGTTDYNQYYIDCIKDTIEQLEKVLSSFDFNEDELIYTSWW